MTQALSAPRRKISLPLARLGYGAAALALLAATGVLEGYELFLASSILSYAIAAMGLNVLMGYNGQISLGHGAFFAIGAYAAAICIDRFAVPFALTPVIAGIVGMGAGWLIGKPALRLEGVYLSGAGHLRAGDCHPDGSALGHSLQSGPGACRGCFC